MYLLGNQNSELFEPRCKEIQHHNGVRFAAIIDNHGNKIAGGFSDDIIPYEGDEQNLHDFYKFAVDISLRKDNLSTTLGELNYIASRRDKVILISFPFPVSSNILLISAEPGMDIEKLALEVVKIFSSESLSDD